MANSETKSISPLSAISSMIWLDSSRMWSVISRDLPGREPLRHDAALPGVFGVVHRDDRHRRGDVGSDALGGRVDLGMARDVGHVLVPADHPQVVDGIPEHRGLVAEPAIALPRVVVEPRVEGIEGERGRRVVGEIGDRHGHQYQSNDRLGASTAKKPHSLLLYDHPMVVGQQGIDVGARWAWVVRRGRVARAGRRCPRRRGR